ncbi:MAG: hypothetical protein HAW67_06845 [Endozoicomonadaceae bacterium]|nr:hypothetical protein [Endozoicomonadaceae bacterium]
MDDLEKYNLESGKLNDWRKSKDWPKIGKGDLSCWSAVPAGLLFAMLFGGKISFIWDMFYLILAANVLCKLSKRNLFQFKRYLMQRWRVKAKSATPYWLTSSKLMVGIITSVLFVSGTPTTAHAAFEIVVPQTAKTADTFESSGDIFLEGGFGKDVQLSTLLQQVLPKPLRAEFAHAELKDLKVDWYAGKRVYLNSVLADINRRYGVLFLWKHSAGVLNVDFDKGLCEKVRSESLEQRTHNATELGLGQPEKALKFIRYTVSDVRSTEYIC